MLINSIRFTLEIEHESRLTSYSGCKDKYLFPIGQTFCFLFSFLFFISCISAKNILIVRIKYYLCNYIMATMTLKENQMDTVKAQLSDLLISISWSDLARRYFGKSGSWLYHKLDGIDGNKRPTEFTYEEKVLLLGALVDLSERIRRAAETLH